MDDIVQIYSSLLLFNFKIYYIVILMTYFYFKKFNAFQMFRTFESLFN